MEIQMLPQGWGARPGPRPRFNPLIHTATTQAAPGLEQVRSNLVVWMERLRLGGSCCSGREMDGETEA